MVFSCPCKRCKNGRGKFPLKEISYHLLKNGIVPTYTMRRFHGERSVRAVAENVGNMAENVGNVDENVGDVGENVCENVDPSVGENVDPSVDENARTYSGVHSDVGSSSSNKRRSFYERAREPLYPSCPKEKTALYAAIKLNNIKTQYGFSDNGVTALLELMKELLPGDNTLPSKYHDVKKMIQELGMDYITYDACVNECILYCKEHASLVKCLVCQESRYKKVFNDERKLTQVAQKTLRHFSLIKRLQRFYSIPWIAEAFYWHHREKSDMNVMRHPVDSSAWQCADNFSPEFAKEPRNVTLGISTDGFNPNGCFGLSHSCWPVILCPYNLPPSMCMNREFSMLCLLISGPRAPGKYIDVYLQPLIDELLQLWNQGVITYDSYTKTEFLMKARLLWAIHDFPALRTLVGCVTHGYNACPTCGEGTVSEYLPYSKKICYMGHRRWLPAKHKYRDDKTHFIGGVEHGSAPWPLTGLQIQEIVANIRTKKGKGRPPSAASLKRKRKVVVENEDVGDVEDQVHGHSLFSRRSILHDLPDWGSNAVRHVTDVMHTEKNITEHLINTVMGNSKSKDSLSARKDMEAMGINKKLRLKVDEVTSKTTMEDGTFAMTKKEKVVFCTVLKNLKVPSGFSSNLRSSVSVDPPEIKNFKSHDYHVVMQHLFPLLVHTATSLPKATVVKGMSDPWRRRKWELRIAYYDPYPTFEARTSRTPPNVTDEDWQTFCRNEEDEKVQKNRVDNKRKREKYDYSHTSGRKPHSLVRAELVCVLH
ncbi:uncharacterized protein LOC113279240 [Papaver somniferum]|uniref:uncharacterized protein LOC113279240 n=1 Tax=Papaver somniferum TaxID=3469 RepID=UPI000E7019C7|nr:uncharacterized protein LOC113279240 [Papaver somniferum]